jgi:deoxyribose-phosphate aldolase
MQNNDKMSMTDKIHELDKAFACRALALLDLTDLTEQATEASTLNLCAKAIGPPVAVAAVCVWPQFVGIAKRALVTSKVKVATVVNFPAGGTNTGRVMGDIAEALDDGADEIDIVFPYKAFLEGAEDIARDMVSEAKATVEGRALKVIFESGLFPKQSDLARAAQIAVTAGADFLKTSTGKAAVSATPDAARTLLGVIKEAGRPVGFKPSGGIRTLEDARLYLGLADEIMGPGWATPATFRFGASGLHGALVAVIGDTASPERGDGVY